MNAALRACAVAVLFAFATVACGDQSEDTSSAESAARRLNQDSLGNPTDTNVTLETGFWHDNVLVPGEGWHLYHYVADKNGFVAFQMQAPPGHPNLWSYLRIVDITAPKTIIWASVGNKRSNLCEVIVDVEEGHTYDVIVTSQENSLAEDTVPQQTDGPYTVAVSPVAVTFP